MLNVTSDQGLLKQLENLTDFHIEKCFPFRDFVLSRFPGWSGDRFDTLPYIPVTAFKRHRLSSVAEDKVFLTMYSSGTSGGPQSRIVLDRETARAQAKSLAQTFSDRTGRSRKPMVLLAGPNSSRNTFSAQDAALNGFGQLGSETMRAFDANGEINFNLLGEFFREHSEEQIIFLGFTFNVWRFVKQFSEESNTEPPKTSIVLHGGGWKKLLASSVPKKEFDEETRKALGSTEVINYYGMIEQTGSIYFECRFGSLHAPQNGTFIVRDPLTLEPLKPGKTGVIQVLSSIQHSYPGHSVLTEDLGHEVEECQCGSSRKALVVEGRLLETEIRGCSDASS